MSSRLARLVASILTSLMAAGCAPHVAYRAGREAVQTVTAADLTGRCLTGTPSGRSFPIAYVEIDEQGYFHDRGQVQRALDLVGAPGNPKYVVVFVHGWFHSAAPDDSHLQAFKCALDDLQGMETNAGDDVIGVYVGWRGTSFQVPVAKYLTFWDRKNTSDEVGRGSLVEFLTRLERQVKPTAASRNKLMLVGHSFGASVVFNSMSQILMERFLLDAETLAARGASPGRLRATPGMVSGYGDLVVLVNPAIEATRLMPFFGSLNAYTADRPDLFSPAQPPRLVILSSEGDWATRITFPAARLVSTAFESYETVSIRTPYGQTLQLGERYLDRQTMGNVDEIHTHDPLRQPTEVAWAGKCPAVGNDWQRRAIEAQMRTQQQAGQPATGAGWVKVFGGSGIELRHRGIATPSSPLWVMAVDTKLIADHNAIANPLMICLFDEILGDPGEVARQGQQHLEYLRAR
jgi:pimeloyl-ACP methyl ester carboxylesterase